MHLIPLGRQGVTKNQLLSFKSLFFSLCFITPTRLGHCSFSKYVGIKNRNFLFITQHHATTLSHKTTAINYKNHTWHHTIISIMQIAPNLSLLSCQCVGFQEFAPKDDGYFTPYRSTSIQFPKCMHNGGKINCGKASNCVWWREILTEAHTHPHRKSR